MPLSTGDRLGPYEIVAPIGKGGMGEVYRAHDSRLKRDVAIKVSTAQFSERFEREAQAIAALNHFNICQLYDVGPNYLVMEYIEGTPLKGPLPVDQALKYAVQICDALDAAHKKGITHRDLKPANILVTKAGIKLLDFGLAKLGTAGIGQAVKPPSDATLTMALTGKNEIVGTLYYMSPEQLQAQANGQEIDGRSDIFSFGLVLYEMLTGKRAFEGSSPASVIAAIMERPAPSIASIAPPSLDRLLQRCLAKDPDDRWQTARDLKAELEWIANASSEATMVATAPARHRSVPWIAAGAMTAVAALAFWAPWRTVPPLDRPLVRLDVDLGADVSLPAPTPGGSTIVISPDGTRLVYVSGTPTRLFTRRLDQPNAIELPGTEGASRPFFSPDGQWVGFVAGGATKLNKISVDGGAVVPLADIVNHAGTSWSEDGSIFVSQGYQKAGLLRIPSDGGPPQTAAELGSGEAALALPQVLPGGKAVMFVAGTGLDVDKLAINVLTLTDHRRKVLVRGGHSPRYLPSSGAASRLGHLIYVNRATLFAVPFDLDRLETRGTAVPVLNDVAYNGPTGVGQFDFSGTGTLVYRRTTGAASATATLQWVYPTDGPSGKPNSKNDRLRTKPGIYHSPSVSPDGTRIAMSVIDGANSDIWVYEPRRDAMTRLTFGGAFYRYPSWSADNQYVVFSSVGQGVFQARADGAGQPQALMTNKTNLDQIPGSFTPDNKWLAYSQGTGKLQIWMVPLEEQSGQLKAGTPEQFLKSNVSDQSPSFSLDGRWLAYQSDESGSNEVYVRPFLPRTSEQDGKWQVSNNGGTGPRWSRSGHELIYQSGDQLLSASYTVRGNDFQAEKPRVWVAKLGAAVLFNGTSDRNWDLAPEGNRVAVATPAEFAEAPKQEHEIVMLLNFFDELRRKVPVGR